MVCSFHLAPPDNLRADRGQEHGRTIPLADFWRLPTKWLREPATTGGEKPYTQKLSFNRT
jgi:hypothetical protein